MVFSAVYHRKWNALNAVRLVLATSVIFIHSFALTGNPLEWAPAHQFLSDFGVDGFFAISGFLIVASWINRPSVVPFLEARAMRILPAFYVCLIVTAFVFAPLSLLLSGSWGMGWVDGSASYVLKNAALWMFQKEIPGTLEGIPYPAIWNLPIWTLAWEFLCYLAVMGLGLLGLLKRVGVLYAAWAACWLGLLVSALGVVDNDTLFTASRFGLMFLTGALFYFLQDRIKLSWGRVAIAGAVILAAAFLPDYRLIAAPLIAYVCIGVGALVKDRRYRLPDDVSYGIYIYAFPLQQLLVIAGAAALGPALFSVASLAVTLPLAALSWFLVEKPMNALKGRLFRRQAVAA